MLLITVTTCLHAAAAFAMYLTGCDCIADLAVLAPWLIRRRVQEAAGQPPQASWGISPRRSQPQPWPRPWTLSWGARAGGTECYQGWGGRCWKSSPHPSTHQGWPLANNNNNDTTTTNNNNNNNNDNNIYMLQHILLGMCGTSPIWPGRLVLTWLLLFSKRHSQ